MQNKAKGVDESELSEVPGGKPDPDTHNEPPPPDESPSTSVKRIGRRTLFPNAVPTENLGYNTGVRGGGGPRHVQALPLPRRLRISGHNPETFLKQITKKDKLVGGRRPKGIKIFAGDLHIIEALGITRKVSELKVRGLSHILRQIPRYSRELLHMSQTFVIASVGNWEKCECPKGSLKPPQMIHNNLAWNAVVLVITGFCSSRSTGAWIMSVVGVGTKLQNK